MDDLKKQCDSVMLFIYEIYLYTHTYTQIDKKKKDFKQKREVHHEQ